MSSKNKNEDGDVFRQAMADVKPLPDSGRIEPEPANTPARATRQAIDDREAFRELLDGGFMDAPETGEELSWLKPGYQQRIIKRLRKGQYSVADTIDLHHMDVATARQVLLDFIEHSVRSQHGCIRIIHGKGLRSRDLPLLKVLTNRLLFKHPRVIAYASCRPVDGGTGATDALLSVPPGARR